VSASIWLPVLAGALAVLALMAAGVVVAGYLVWRYGRRRWRAFHSHGAVVGALALWEAAAGLRRRGGAVGASDEDVRRWTARKVRRELWRSVDRAESAVRAAADVGAPTAELPALCRRLQAAAVDLDKVLRTDPSGSALQDIASLAGDVMRAATDVQQAAVVAAGDASGHAVRALTEDAASEIRLLDAGLASAQSALPRRPL
jgi:hypothetical protein